MVGRLRTAIATAVAAWLLIAPGASSAAPADIDRGFGSDGAAHVSNGFSVPPATTSTQRGGEDMVVAPGGEIYVLATVLESCAAWPCRTQLFVERLRPDGSVDPAFGFGGVSAPIWLAEPDRYDAQRTLALAPDGKVLVAHEDRGNVVLTRFAPEGRIDASFGVAGTVTVDFGANEIKPSVAVAADGGVVVALESGVSSGRRDLVVARYRPDGSPDPAFRGSGAAPVRFGSPGGLALAADGRILLGAPGCCESTAFAYFGRLLANGAAAAPGPVWRRHSVGPNASVNSVLALSRGKTLLLGTVRGSAFALRLRADGRPDRGFGRAGIVRMGSIDLRVAPQATVDRAGRMVVVGASEDTGEEPFSNYLYALRRRPDGRPDLTFGGGRPVRVDSYLSAPLALGLQSGGRIVLFAESGSCVRTCFSRSPVLLRFLGGSSRAGCLGARATIVGTREGERLVGTRGRDVIAGLGGDDSVQGRGGSDLICGGAGSDELVGGPGRDRLRQD